MLFKKKHTYSHWKVQHLSKSGCKNLVLPRFGYIAASFVAVENIFFCLKIVGGNDLDATVYLKTVGFHRAPVRFALSGLF